MRDSILAPQTTNQGDGHDDDTAHAGDAGGLLATAGTTAHTWPDKAIRLIVPWPPGGGTDIISRVISDKLSSTLGWKIVVENKPGAGGTLGLDAAAKARPDGYTIAMGQFSNLAIAPSLMSGLPYDPIKDFAHITLVSAIPVAIAVGADSPIKPFADLVAAAKANPGKLLFASPGNATVAHISGEYLQKAVGIKYKHLPYKGTAQALPDVMSGRANFYMASVESVRGPAKAGQLRLIAVTSARRASGFPDVPMVAESGFAGFSAVTWFGLVAPAGTQAAIETRLSRTAPLSCALSRLRNITSPNPSKRRPICPARPCRWPMRLKSRSRWAQQTCRRSASMKA